MKSKEDKSCWECGWAKCGGITLLPVCWWFYKSTGMGKEIPCEICDKGCKFWTAEKQDFTGLTVKPIVREEEL